MNAKARIENARTLAQALGIGEEEAAMRLKLNIAITTSEGDIEAQRLGDHVARMMARTVEGIITMGNHGDVAAELVIGLGRRRFKVPAIFASINDKGVTIGPEQIESRGTPHRISLLIGACYACGALFRAALGEQLPYSAPPVLVADLESLLGGDLLLLDNEVDFGDVYLAGAGAIGNGFVLGLSQFNVKGRLIVCDDDVVSEGNLQRCLYFEDCDVRVPKAERLCQAICDAMPNVVATPFRGRLQNWPERSGPWLRRLVVGVDSPRARRELQSEIPGEVFDASTTGATEIVFHFHKQPTTGACMSCVYHESPQEEAHERHVAEALGVRLDDVRQSRVSPAAAIEICRRYPHLVSADVEGAPYDTLFKQLCSTGKLVAVDGRQVLAPFAFVSVLAGAFLALELVRRIQRGHRGLFNEWRISPWSSPVLRRRRALERRIECTFCGDPVIARVAAELWAAP